MQLWNNKAEELLWLSSETSKVRLPMSSRNSRSWLFIGFRGNWHDGNNKQEAQLMLTNPRDAFRGQSWSPNIYHSIC